MTRPKLTWFALFIALAVPLPSAAQTTHDHDAHAVSVSSSGAPHEPGQSAFAAIAEVVEILRSDPATDWSKVDIEALRRHLIDMDNVTLRAAVTDRDTAGGAAFDVTSTDPDVAASIGRMVHAHAATMTGKGGITMLAEAIPGGARLTVTGPDPAMIRGLGFIGLMTIGMHHEVHHLALARGGSPHAH